MVVEIGWPFLDCYAYSTWFEIQQCTSSLKQFAPP